MVHTYNPSYARGGSRRIREAGVGKKKKKKRSNYEQKDWGHNSSGRALA
jgi:hypothetical protein